MTLTNASIAGTKSEMLNNKYADNMAHKEREHRPSVTEDHRHLGRRRISGEDDRETPNA